MLILNKIPSDMNFVKETKLEHFGNFEKSTNYCSIVDKIELFKHNDILQRALVIKYIF